MNLQSLQRARCEPREQLGADGREPHAADVALAILLLAERRVEHIALKHRATVIKIITPRLIPVSPYGG